MREVDDLSILGLPMFKFILSFLSLFFAVGLGLLGTGIFNLWRSTRAAGWPIAPGAITSLETRGTMDGPPTGRGTGGGGGASFKIKVRYAYQVDGIEYEGSRIAFGYGGSSECDEQTEIYRKLAGAEVVAVRYDPANPSTSCLSAGPHRLIWATLAFAVTWLSFVGGFAAMVWFLQRPDSVLLDNLMVRSAATEPPRGWDGPKVGEAFPDIVAVDAAGDAYSMGREDLKGKVVLLTFWTLDPESLSGMPKERLGRLSREFADDERFQIITVCVNALEEPAAFGEFWRQRNQGGTEPRIGGSHWWVMAQSDAEEPTTAQRYGVVDTPAYYLIDRDGRLAGVRIAPDELRETIARLLKQ